MTTYIAISGFEEDELNDEEARGLTSLVRDYLQEEGIIGRVRDSPKEQVSVGIVTNPVRERAHPEYTSINVFCPVCGCDEFSSTTEDVPHSFTEHQVNPVCKECETMLTIRFRAIDITWYDKDDGFHSAVAQGAIVPKYEEYPKPERYAALRRSVDYWYVAVDEDGGWEPIASYEDALDRIEDDDYEVHIARPTVMKP